MGDEDADLGLSTGHVRTFIYKQNLEASAVEQLFMTGSFSNGNSNKDEVDHEGNINKNHTTFKSSIRGKMILFDGHYR